MAVVIESKKRLGKTLITRVNNRTERRTLLPKLLAALTERLISDLNLQDDDYGIRIGEGLGTEIYLVHARDIIPGKVVDQLAEYARGFKDAHE
jgi:hypothetical protein